ncbi:hypothetical protein NRB56_76720 [Nocardia sp. RB56]|uniref:Uncharacterized protein n=1 Tax=Nocardia aurantia TaxID=2585199 RepID=A0A7K0E213_9NOCA|nr:hypothetical protein [Nocardia aurantia]
MIISSVRSGATSLIAPTMVVLPTPNPPAIRIFTEAASWVFPAAGSESTNAIEYRSQ